MREDTPYLLPAPFSTRLLLLIGLPGSGKSTLVRELQRQCALRQVICPDAIRADLFGDANTQGPWLKVWQQVDRQFRQTVDQIAAGHVTEGIYDATNAVRRQRRQVIVLARAAGFSEVWGIWLQTPLWLCLERNQQRHRQAPPSVILRMHRCLVGAPPALEDGFDQLIEMPCTAIAPSDITNNRT